LTSSRPAREDRARKAPNRLQGDATVHRTEPAHRPALPNAVGRASLGRTTLGPITLGPITLGVVLLLAGCAGGSGRDAGSGLPTLGASTAGTAAAGSPSGPASTASVATRAAAALPSAAVAVQVSALPKDARGVYTGAVLDRERLTGSDDEVLASWLSYWTLRMRTLHAAKLDDTALDRVATGMAAREVTEYVDLLRTQNAHVIGYLRLTPRSISRTDGAVATIEDCLYDTSVNATWAGIPLEAPVFEIGTRGTLTRSGGRWLVGELVRDPKVCSS
jgi:hypothetical protein